MAYLDISLNMFIDPLRVRHVFDHDITDLQGGVPEAKLQ